MDRVTRSLRPVEGDATEPMQTAGPDAAPESDAIAPGTILADRLRVIRKLGQGGMGAVYEVEHLHTKHHRALKLLHPRYAKRRDSVERFLREASAAGRIGNPHIVDTFDAGQLPSGAPFIVMELLEGRPLDQLLAERGRLGVHETVSLLCQACEGAEAAHRAGIVHRDLKPQNLFVTRRAGEPFVKLLDFGISKFDSSLVGNMELTSEGSQLGTPYYMSPEQLMGRSDLDAKTDVYALGVILYECISGCRPFEARSLSELSVRVHAGDYVPIEQRVPGLPSGLAAIVRRAMHYQAVERFDSAEALSDALASLSTSDELGDTVFSPGPAPAAKRGFLWLIVAALLFALGIGYALTRQTKESAATTPSATLSPRVELTPLEEPRATPSAASSLPERIAPRPPDDGARKPDLDAGRRSVQQKLNTENPY